MKTRNCKLRANRMCYLCPKYESCQNRIHTKKFDRKREEIVKLTTRGG